MTSSVSTLGQTLDNSARLRTIQSQLYDLQTQLASGKKAQQFSGLGTDAILTLRARADLTQIETYKQNITLGLTRAKLTEQTLAEFREQAEKISDSMQNQMQKGDIDLDLVKQFASDGVRYLRELLNSRDGDRYLLSGADTYTPPINDTGAHATYMDKLLQDWTDGTITTDQLIASYTTTPETTMGYSPALSSGQARDIYVRADVQTDVPYGVFANEDGFKDILNALTLVQQIDIDKISLEDDDNPLSTTTAPGTTPAEQRDNFFKLFEHLIGQVNNGMKELVKSQQYMDRVQLQLTNIQDGHKVDANNLTTTIGNIENVDPTEVAVKIAALQIQLTAAYQTTASLSQLSLTQYL